MRRGSIHSLAFAAMAAALSGVDDGPPSKEAPVRKGNHQSSPSYTSPPSPESLAAAASIREDRARRKAENFAKRQPKEKPV